MFELPPSGNGEGIGPPVCPSLLRGTATHIPRNGVLNLSFFHLYGRADPGFFAPWTHMKWMDDLEYRRIRTYRLMSMLILVLSQIVAI
jgi:hypothetical protein